ncbi:hypothetical protein H4219_000184 [Mycoemilia scoparia]|uniref:Peptidase M20 dimerisation domain-containing protein n=1 Tax=Mycoemilia scoparia TaxID=417184 RepID=A0A9W8AA34_9FUNG|nr:hypothetical protein H4219_000184 [Mycoemilia scoparia]
MDSLSKYYETVEQDKQHYIDRLSEIVAIPSVSCSADHRPDVVRMGHWLKDQWEALGAETKLVNPGTQELEGKTLDLPPVVLGKYGNDPAKKTLLVYGHYDVQPALKEDGWSTDPFKLVINDKEQMVGRGSTDDKGPVLGWLCSAEAYKKAGLEYPVNLKFCFEGMEESGSEGLEEVIRDEADKWFKGTDVVCISDNYWLGKEKPCLTYGLRGVSYFYITVQGPGADLHSGVFGGTVHEPMTDLVNLMSKLVDVKGKILIPGIYDGVAPVTDEEHQAYEGLEFKHSDMEDDLKHKVIVHDEEKKTLMHRWRMPSLSLHGIEGAFYNPGAKTVIPARVIGKFSIRTVPNMDRAEVARITCKYLNEEFAKLGSKNKMTAEMAHDGPWWYSSPKHPNFVAGAKAMERVFGVQPDLTREGGSIPITISFQEALNCNVLLLPMGSADDGAHSINEKLNIRNFIEGIKVFGAYVDELSKADL